MIIFGKVPHTGRANWTTWQHLGGPNLSRVNRQDPVLRTLHVACHGHNHVYVFDNVASGEPGEKT
jgi:hypothetical protein